MSFEQDHERRHENMRRQVGREAAQEHGGFAAEMTLRQFYAAMAMIGFVSEDLRGEEWAMNVAHDSFAVANAMIRREQLEKNK